MGVSPLTGKKVKPINNSSIPDHLLHYNYLPSFNIVCIGVSTPQKHPPLSFLPRPPLNLQTVQAPHFLGNTPPYILAFREPPPSPKNWIFQ